MKYGELYPKIIEKLLAEVDDDIREIMMSEDGIANTSKYLGAERGYRGYELLPDAANTILQWQALRDRKTLSNNHKKK